MSDDDYIDFILMEAAMLKTAEEDREAEKKAKREEWKRRPVGSEE